MKFANQNNKVRINGYVASEITKNCYNTEFTIGVARKTSGGERGYSDYFSVYINDPATMNFVVTHLKKGASIIIKGELRNFKDGSIKICSSDITLPSTKK